MNKSFKAILYKHGCFIVGNKCNGFSRVKCIIVFLEANCNTYPFAAIRTFIYRAEILIGIAPFLYKLALDSAFLAGIIEQTFINERTVDIADCIGLEKKLLIKRIVTGQNISCKIIAANSPEAFGGQQTVIQSPMVRKAVWIHPHILGGIKKTELFFNRYVSFNLKITLNVSIV